MRGRHMAADASNRITRQMGLKAFAHIETLARAPETCENDFGRRRAHHHGGSFIMTVGFVCLCARLCCIIGSAAH